MSDAPEDAPPDADTTDADTTDAPAAPEQAKANVALIDHDAIHGESPRDGSKLAPVPITPVGEIAASVRRAAKASVEHGALDLEARARLLRRFADALLARGEELAAVIEAETGKPAVEAWLHEVLPVADLRDYWCVEGPMYLAATEPPLDAMSYPGKRALVERRPRGVVALITPWNFPAALPLRTIFPALLAGDAVMRKPSEHTPRTAALLVELARGVYGADLVQIVQGDGHAGAALIAAGVDAVVFTGSVPTGRKVAHLAADALVPVSLELGGKDAAIVLDDAPLERTARGVLFGAMINAGQNCAGIERVYATPGIAKALRARVAELAKELVPGRDVGPLCTAAQLATVHAHVQAARDAGAEVLAGGEDVEGAGRYYAPTVLAGVPADNAALLEESFGPIVPILEVADVDAAVEAANSGRFGLTASVWTRKVALGEQIARRLRAGVVVVNDHGFSGAVPALPWSGVGESGYGVTNSSHALDLLTRPWALVISSPRKKSELWWHPYTPGLLAVAKALVALRGGAGLMAKPRAVGQLLGGMIKRNRLEAPVQGKE